MNSSKAVEPAIAWSVLQRESPVDFIAALREAGAPASVLRSFATAIVDDLYREREALPQSAAGTTTRKDWWQADAWRPLENQLALFSLKREKLAHLLLLAGPGEEPNDGLFDYIAPEKRGTARLVGESFDSMIAAMRSAGGIFLTASEKDKIKQLEAQRDREFLTLLTADELAEYKLRTSRTTRNLRHRLGEFDATESEFKAIYAIRKVVDDGGRIGPAEEKWMMEQFKDALGESRGTAVIRAMDSNYRSLQQMAAANGLPPGAADKVYDLRDALSAECQRLAASSDLSAKDRQAAFAALASSTRSGIMDTLGATAGAAYLKGPNSG